MPTHLIDLVDRLAGRNVVLVGDLMLDKYVYGDAERLSPDAPVPVLQFRKEDARLGGAGRVAADLTTLGCSVRVVSIPVPTIRPLRFGQCSANGAATRRA